MTNEFVVLPDFEKDTKGKVLAFDGDTSLKPCKAHLEYTKEHIEEYMKCKNDIMYFIENYMYIVTMDQGSIKPVLRDYQRTIIQSYLDHKRNIVLASRQIGKTTTSIAYILWYILFHDTKSVAILANVHAMAIEIMSNLKISYSLLPKWLQQGVKVWNEKSIRLENGVKVYAAATSKNAIRGRSISLLVLDELSTVSPAIWNNFSQSVFPTISSSKESQIIITSTPFGRNHFYELWKGATDEKEWNGYKPLRVDWWEVPGRDDAWREQSLKDLSGDLRKWQQEYGNSFSESGYTLIDGKVLATIQDCAENIYHNIPLEKRYTDYIKVYETPLAGHIYSVGLDSSEMQEHSVGDSISIQVLDVTSVPFIQVATCNIRAGISYLEVPEIAVAIGNYYNTAYIFIEQNSTGLEIANNIVNDIGYENIYYEKKLPGYKTTKRTKRLGCSNLKMLVEGSYLILKDFETISQLTTFTKSHSSFKADSGYLDDAVMALLGAIFFMLDRTSIEHLASINFSQELLTQPIEIKNDNNIPQEEVSGILVHGFIGELDDYGNTELVDWSWLRSG